MKGYNAYVLTEESRSELLTRFPPIYDNVIAHHITNQFGINIHDSYIPTPGKVTIIGTRIDEERGIQILVANVDGTNNRKDGGTFHITLSLDTEKGASPKDSNESLKDGWTMNLPYPIEVTPEFIAFN